MTQERIYQQIGVAIRLRRKKLELTQHKLAARLGISRAALANIEIGRQKVYVHHLYGLAAALELQPHELLPLPTEVTAGTAAQIPLPQGLKPEQRSQIVQLLAGIDLNDKQKMGGNS